MDLKDFNLSDPAESGADVVIKHPVTGEDTDVTVSVVGRDSPTFRNAVKQQSLHPFDPKDEEAARKSGAQLIAACIRGWSGLEQDGKPLKFSAEKAIEILSKPEFDPLAEQIWAAINNRAVFTKASASN